MTRNPFERPETGVAGSKTQMRSTKQEAHLVTRSDRITTVFAYAGTALTVLLRLFSTTADP